VPTPISTRAPADRRKATVHITHHAAERAIQRHGCTNLRDARHTLRRAWSSAVQIPPRYARQLSSRDAATKPKRRGPKIRFRVAGSVLMVCRGRRILTTWRLDEEQAASVLWWVAANRWELSSFPQIRALEGGSDAS